MTAPQDADPPVTHNAAVPDAAEPVVQPRPSPGGASAAVPSDPVPTVAPGQQATAQAGTEPYNADAAQAETGAEGPPRRSRRNRRRGRKGRSGLDGANVATEPGVQAAQTAVELPPMPDAGELFASVTSGAFDSDTLPAEPESDALAAQATDGDASPVETTALEGADVAAAQDPARRVLAPDADSPKLQKVLAQAGVGSRRDLEQMIVDKRVTVNDEPAHIGQRISWGDRVAVDGKPVRDRKSVV
jgi:23S rRNA pseudouridine2605 synthase